MVDRLRMLLLVISTSDFVLPVLQVAEAVYSISEFSLYSGSEPYEDTSLSMVIDSPLEVAVGVDIGKEDISTAFTLVSLYVFLEEL